MTNDEELKILERAESFYEIGIPGAVVAFFLGMCAPFFGHWETVASTSLIIMALSYAAIRLGGYYKDKVLP